MQIDFNGRTLTMDQCHVMGILNVTPDSFSDGGQYTGVSDALFRARRMVDEGAAFIDVGGESTRPGAAPVSVQEELDRVCPVVEAVVRELDVVVSVDTSTPELMAATAQLGAGLINDVRALNRPGAVEAVRQAGLPVCLMHMQGQPVDMQVAPRYQSVTRQVSAFLMDRVRVAEEAGIAPENILLDPGFGFGKNLQHNLQLLATLDRFRVLGYPLLVGLSRKSMLGAVTGREVTERLPASLAAATIAAMKGAAIIRVHDVRETVDAVRLVSAVKEAGL
ncbi:dihydropteroate synthase [Marinobacter sp. X15-166B]|uniref:dihydropteroate synthase n=1 Tax=Marinobacter sp. X15-166B TaxID=1897620 RepID=UPI00085C9B3E|nr:dihydropteroate synthase [Marinobacter sp. X15-166B]OEY65616.1 dihydropteroate synthase [Marinobacter sp. X15-166B]